VRHSYMDVWTDRSIDSGVLSRNILFVANTIAKVRNCASAVASSCALQIQSTARAILKLMWNMGMQVVYDLPAPLDIFNGTMGPQVGVVGCVSPVSWLARMLL